MYQIALFENDWYMIGILETMCVQIISIKNMLTVSSPLKETITFGGKAPVLEL